MLSRSNYRGKHQGFTYHLYPDIKFRHDPRHLRVGVSDALESNPPKAEVGHVYKPW